MTVPAASPTSYDAALAAGGNAPYLVWFQDAGPRRGSFGTHPFRDIGGRYVPADPDATNRQVDVPAEFDGMVFVGESTPANVLPQQLRRASPG